MTSLRRLLLSLLVLALPALAAAQTYTISPPPFLLAQTNAGAIINNACIWTYVAGTSTPATTYTSSTGTANSNPIRSDTAGRFTAYLSPGSSYKFVYETACTPPAHGTTLRTADNISAMPISAATVDVTGLAGESITAGQCVYLSDGSGSKTPSQWYKCDSANTYSSVTLPVGIATVNISSGLSGTIRVAGAVTGLTLNAGSAYFAGTAGALTTTAPTNARYLGQADSATSLVLSGNPPLKYLVSPVVATSMVGPFTLGCGVRLTLTAGTPITTADVTAATNVFVTPYSNGGWGAGTCALYDGSAAWTTLPFTELTQALGTLVNAQAYDVFAYNNSGVMATELAEWANAAVTMTIAAPGVVTWTGHGMSTGNSITFTTTGALPTGLSANTQYFITVVDANTFKLSTTLALVAAGTFITTSGTQSGVHTGHQPQARATALVLQNGVLVKTGTTTRRYLGSFVTTTTTTTEDSLLRRLVSNYYNRVRRPLRVTDATANWPYAIAAYRQANGSTANQVEVMQGFAESVTDLYVAHNGGGPAGAGSEFRTSIGDGLVNTADTAVTGGAGATIGGGAYAGSQLNGHLSKILTAGWHRLLWLENSNGGAAITWNSYGTSTNGLSGWVEN